ncbi:MAG: exodeoxyribonuclease large subunit, partial [Frankiales bacterium]|nr:exodeoxyribonuclease large subunit [Frankiales bacterium]
AACRTPVVSAIGHEQDSPLLDLVADYRASTPTDAGKRVVPDVTEELARVNGLRDRARRTIVTRIDRETAGLAALRSRPVMSDPDALLRRHSDEISGLRDRSRRRLGAALDHAANDLQHTRARVVALSPAATLERGYAVIQASDGTVVREPVEAGQELTVRVAGGRFEVTTIGGAR